MYSLLVVDDEHFIVNSLSEMFLSSNLPLKEIKTAYNGKMALELFAKSPFDIVISDIRMPEMDGIELLRSIQKLWKSTHFIFLTGFADFEYARQAVKLNAFDFLLKPVSDEDLLSCIRKAISDLDAEYVRMAEIDTMRAAARKAFTEMQYEFFSDMLKGAAYSYNILDERFAGLSLPFHAQEPVSTAIVRIDDYGKQRENKDGQNPENVMQNILKEMLSETFHEIAFPYVDGMMIVIMQKKAENMTAFLSKRMEQLQELIYHSLGITTSIAVTENLAWDQWSSGSQYLIMLLKQNPGKSKLIFSNNNTKGFDTDANDGIVNSVKSYIDKNLDQPITLSGLATTFRINPSYLSRVFHKATGMQLISYITNRKIEKAKRLLIESNLKVYEISKDIGYDHSDYFAKIFKKIVGISPLDYRNRKISKDSNR